MTSIQGQPGVFVGATAGTDGSTGIVPKPVAGQQTSFLRGDGTWAAPGGGGNVNGPVSSTDGDIATFNGASGTIIKDSSVNITAGAMTGLTALTTTSLTATTNFTFGAGTGALKASGGTVSVGTLPVADGGTNVTSYTAGSVIFAGAGGTSLTENNAQFFWDNTADALKLRTGYTYQFGTNDAFARSQIWNFDTNAVLRLGSLGSDGDPTTTSSEGIVVYGPAVNGSMAPGNWGIGRIKVDRIGLLSNVPGGLQDYYFRADPTSLFLRNDSSVKTFEVTRNTGNIKTSLTAGIVQSDASGNLSVTTIPSFTWNTTSGVSATLVANNGYLANNIALVTYTLPATAAVGDTFEITAQAAGLFTIAQNAGQTIRFGNLTTTTGAGGSITATAQGDTLRFICSVANTGFQVLSSLGNLTII